LAEGATVSEPLFTEGVRAAMRMGTSSAWAADLTTDDLPALIWMVGEYGRRAGHILEALDAQWAASPPHDAVAAARAKLALEGLFRFFAGDRPNESQYIARWGPISERAWAAGHGREPELPPEEMGDLWPVVWKGQPVGSIKDPRHNLFGCVGLWVSAVPPSESFAAALGSAPQSPLVVSVGGVRALVKQSPSELGSLSVCWV
jgi:hypothetical protein